MTLAETCARVEADVKRAYPELVGDDPLYFHLDDAGVGHCYGYSYYRPAAPSSSPPFIVEPEIDARGRAAIAFGLHDKITGEPTAGSDDRIWHERGHSIEALAVRRGHRGYVYNRPPAAYDADAFQERFWRLRDLPGTYFSNYSAGTSRSPEVWAETGAVLNTGCTPLVPGCDVVLRDPELVAFFRALMTEVKAPMPIIVDPAGFLLSHPITRLFADMSFPQYGFHTGLDIGMNAGTPVAAIRAGVVEVDDDDAYYDANRPATWSGISVWIRCDDGELWGYCHLMENSVSKGQVVEAGTVIGRCGSTGASTAPHLHLERRAPNGVAIDPLEEVQMLSETAQDQVREIVRSETTASERRILDAVKDYNPLIQVGRRILRTLRGEVRDPGTAYPDDTEPIT